MDTVKVNKLQEMIGAADFLNEATKQVFLEKIPYLNEKKFEDLYDVFEGDLKKRQIINERKNQLFVSYKAKVTGFYQKAKHLVISFKEKAVSKIEERELTNLDQELNQL